MANKHPADHTRYEVITQEDEHGDLIVPIPPPLLERLGWKEGDDIDFDIREDGTFLLQRIAK